MKDFLKKMGEKFGKMILKFVSLQSVNHVNVQSDEV